MSSAPSVATAPGASAVPAWLARASLFVMLMAAAATLWFGCATLSFRPLDTIEGELLFEATRIRRHLPLYTDPLIGVFDHGAPPSRYYVLHPPLWPALLSLLPEPAMAIGGRVIALASWMTMTAWLAITARPVNRRATTMAALYALATFMLGRYAVTATADVVAAVIATIALARSATRERLDAAAAVLLTFAAFVKPNVMGIAAGLFAHEILRRGPDIVRAMIAAAAAALGLVIALHGASHGAWVHHLTSSTMQKASLERLVEQVIPRLPLLGLPHALALYAARRQEGRGRSLASWALGASLVWSLLSLAKIGSSTNYFFEPTLAALVVLRGLERRPEVRFSARELVIFAASLAVFSINVPQWLLAMGRARDRARTIADVRSICGAGPSDAVLGDHPGLEMMIDGRVVMTPFQMTNLVKNRHFPVETWLADVRAREVRCLVAEGGALGETPHNGTELFPREVEEALRDEMQLVTNTGGLHVYRRR